MADFKPRGGAKDFWNTVKGISVNEIIREASRPISVALVGTQELRQATRRALNTSSVPSQPEATAMPEPSFLQEFDSTSPDNGFPTDPAVYDLIIDVGSGRVDAPE